MIILVIYSLAVVIVHLSTANESLNVFRGQGIIPNDWIQLHQVATGDCDELHNKINLIYTCMLISVSINIENIPSMSSNFGSTATSPSRAPTVRPTSLPSTLKPIARPTIPPSKPTAQPTTESPTLRPTTNPSRFPTQPSKGPTIEPSTQPSTQPTVSISTFATTNRLYGVMPKAHLSPDRSKTQFAQPAQWIFLLPVFPDWIVQW